MSNERQRIDDVYKRRQSLTGRYIQDNAGNRYNTRSLRNAIALGLSLRFKDISVIRQLDLGAGELFWTGQFLELGINRGNCLATDILDWRLRRGLENGYDIQVLTASAAELPLMENSFDLVTQLTMMTSVLDDRLRRQIAGEMIRVLKPGGYILWYDFRYNNPRNKFARAIGRAELIDLFKPLGVECQTLTLLPPLARKICGAGDKLLKLISALPILRSHLLAFIGPKE